MSPESKKAIKLTTAIAVIGITLTAAGIVGAAFADRATTANDIDNLQTHVDDHECRLRAVEDVVTTTSVNVNWIRERMESEHP